MASFSDEYVNILDLKYKILSFEIFKLSPIDCERAEVN